MPVFSKETLAKRSRLFRYLHFLISSVSLKSFSAWKAEGEPNPFVSPTYRHKGTRQVEFLDIFGDYRRPPSHDAT